MLNTIFEIFDSLSEKMGLEKIKTIGNAYMIVGGVTDRDPMHCQRIAEFAIEGLKQFKQFKQFAEKCEYPLQIRIGIHTGTVVAGVVGTHKFTFDFWGDVVNIASRMESSGVPDTIQVSNAVQVRLADDFDFIDRGETDLKGKGLTKTWELLERKSNTEPIYDFTKEDVA